MPVFNHFKKLLLVSVFTASLLVTNTSRVLAACDPTTEGGFDFFECLTLDDGNTVKDVYSTPNTLINLIVRNLFVIAGLILFAMIIYSGFIFITNGTSKAKDEAKTIMTTAGIGFLIMFAAYWIIQIVELMTGTNLGIGI